MSTPLGLSDAAGLREALDAGATLPADWYSDPAVLRLEEERIFGRTWQYAGRADLVAEPGSYLTSFAGRIPVVVVRDRDETLRGFVNVCRHRGHIVAEGAGRRNALQCPYHAWTYDLDGTLRAAPRSERPAYCQVRPKIRYSSSRSTAGSEYQSAGSVAPASSASGRPAASESPNGVLIGRFYSSLSVEDPAAV